MNQIGRFDRLGSGVRNINKYLPIYASGAKPVFTETDRGSFKLTIPLVEKTVQAVTPEVTPEVGKMLGVMTGEMKRSEIMESLGLKDEKHFREYYQQAAMMAGVIEMTIPDKPNSRMQKYRLTDKGMKLLKDGIQK